MITSSKGYSMVAAALVTAAALFPSGCTTNSGLSDGSSRPRPNTPIEDEVTSDESVRIRALTDSDLRKYTDELDWDQAVKEKFNARVNAELGAAPFGVDMLAGMAVGFIFDQIKAYIAGQAEKHQRQFGATLYGDGFWAGPPEYNKQKKAYTFVPNVRGVEIIRLAGRFQSDKKPAFRLVCLFKSNAADKRLLLIRPICLEVNGAKARVSGSKLNTKLDLSINATWIDRWQAVHATQIAMTSFEFPAINMQESKVQIEELNGKTAGWFAGIPVSVDPRGKLIGDGVYSIKVNITETDLSRAKEFIEKIGRLIEAERGNAEKTVKEVVK